MTGFGRRRVLGAILLMAAALVAPLVGPVINASAATDITFVGMGHSDPASQKFKQAVVPSSAQVGDTLVMVFTRATTVAWTGPSAITGWTQVDSFAGGSLTSTLYRKTVGPSDLGATVRFDTANFAKALLTVSVYRGVNPASPFVTAHAYDAATTTNHASPTVSGVFGQAVMSYWVDRSDTTTSWSTPAPAVTRGTVIGTGTGRYSGLVADSGGTIDTSTYGGLVGASGPTTRALKWTIALPPAESTGNQPPTAAFSNTCAALDCLFDSSQSVDPEGNALSYAWDFDDGGQASVASPSHRFPSAGTYDVKLTVTDDAGNPDSVTQQVIADDGSQPATISFVGVGHSDPQSQKFKQVAIPSGAHAGDLALMEFTRASTVTWTGPSRITGWTQVDSFTAAGLTSTIWRKTLTAGDLGQAVRFDTADFAKALLTVAVYRGVDTTAGVTATHASDTSRTAHVSPSIVVNDGDWVVSSWVDRSSSTTGWTASGSMTSRNVVLSDVSGRYSGVVADSGGPVVAGTFSGKTATSTPATVALMWTVKLDETASAAADVVDEINCNFGDDEASLWIHYRMLDGQPAINNVQFGATAAYGKTATAIAPAILPVDRGGVFLEAKLTGLAPGQLVHYRIGANGVDHACPTPPTGDFRWDDIGDTGTTLCTPWVATTHALVAADDPDFVTHGGDMSYANVCGAPAVHQYYVDQQVWSTQAAFQPTWGNHEYAQPEPGAPPGTPRDRLANYKGRSTITHAQTLALDGQYRQNPPGCPALPGSNVNSCRGEDWGWFRVSGVLFISYPEPWDGAMAEWRDRVHALMLDAASDPAISFVVTYGHRPAYTSQPNNGVQLDVRDALNALGDEFGTGAGGKYVLNVAHHVHGEEAFSEQHGVVHLTNGGGGEGQTNLQTATGLSFKSRHPGYLTGDYTAATHRLNVRLRCGPQFGTSTADPCTQGSTLYSVSFTGS